ncbi:MAG: hypothetical protein LUG24_01440 [Clostridiales bacterium]|nr:hypothetical protein [Clostridiales bacterium]
MNLILRKTVPAVIFIINTAFVISNFGLSMYMVIILCLCFLLCSAANSTVHEAGHFVFGKITGYILFYINIGFLTLYKDNNDKLRLKLTPETKYRCIMYPSKDKKQVTFYITQAVS